MIKSNFFRFLFLFAFFLFHISYAQDTSQTGSEDEESPPPVTDIHFSVYVWPVKGILTENSRIPELPRVFYDSPEGIRRVRLSRNVATELMPYNGEIPLQFFDVERIETPPPSDALPDAPPTVTYRKIPLTEVSFPASWEQVLFIMMPADPDRRESLRIFPMRYDVAHVRPGYIRIFNTTENNLVVEVEDEHHELRAYSPVDFRPPTVGEHQVFRLNIYGRDERTGAPRLRLTTRVTSRDAKSNFYLLYPDSPRRLRLMRVGGHEPPPTPTPEPTPAP